MSDEWLRGWLLQRSLGNRGWEAGAMGVSLYGYGYGRVNIGVVRKRRRKNGQ